VSAYDDADIDCPMCSRGLDVADLCEHNGPLCPRCCTLYHDRLAVAS